MAGLDLAVAYDYENRNGDLLFQCLRYVPKTFRQRRPDGRGGWIWDLHGVSSVPYKLRSIISARAKKDPIFIVEGEKDADNLSSAGLLATTNHGGAGNWRPEYRQYFYGKSVCLIPHNDDPGRRHSDKIGENLKDWAIEIRIIDLKMKDKGADVSDWLANGNTSGDLLELWDCAKTWAPPAQIREEMQQMTRKPKQNNEISPNIEKARSIPLHCLLGLRPKTHTKCLWHDDEHASLYLYPEGHGYCFVCSRRVSSIDWTMKTRSLRFIDAVRELL